ncbi:MAG: hypothetical protein ABI723_20905 [Bacteroidia bacterium]
MKLKVVFIKSLFAFFMLLLFAAKLEAQSTQIRGFAEALAGYQQDKLSFGLGEQDLFITSELSDKVSFLGESVFKYTGNSPTYFDVSIERIVIKYNIKGNNNFLIGKHHTPINYWNDTYHHGRVFFPTIYRPALFAADIIPLHTTGISFQGHDFGKIKFGYDLMIGNGIGSSDVADNDKYKSVTAAIHIKPADGLRLGASWYNDHISEGASMHGETINYDVKQNLITGSVAYFHNKIEVLSEATLAMNHTDTTGTQNTIAAYFYAGYKIKEKWVPYIRIDYLKYEEGEVYYHNNNTTAFVGGLRYQINYLAVIKVEYEHDDQHATGLTDKYTMQFAIGF